MGVHDMSRGFRFFTTHAKIANKKKIRILENVNMNDFISTGRVGRLAASLALAGAATMFAGGAGAQDTQWIQDMMHESCDAAIKSDMAQGIRDTIENSVKRAEASINPAIPIGDLSCLNDLMSAPLDTFSNIGGLMGSLTSGLAGSLPIGDLMNGGVSRQVCQFAMDKWNEVTQPLTGAISSLSNPSFASSFTASGSSGSYFNNPNAATNTASTSPVLSIGTAGLASPDYVDNDTVDEEVVNLYQACMQQYGNETRCEIFMLPGNPVNNIGSTGSSGSSTIPITGTGAGSDGNPSSQIWNQLTGSGG